MDLTTNKSFKDMVLDVQVAENLGKKHMYYNTIRPNVPKSRRIRMPFFGACNVHKIHEMPNGEFKLTVEVGIRNARNALQGMSNHMKNLDNQSTGELRE